MDDLIKDVDKKDTHGKTALHLAAESNDLPQVQRLLSQGADINARVDFNNSTPLLLAAINNIDDSHFNLCEILLKNGADTEVRRKWDKTAFYFLAENGNLKIIQLFLNYKADVHAVTKKGENLLLQAAYNYNNWEVMKLLIDLGLDINHKNNSKETPLHIAAAYNKNESHLKIIELLLKNGADVDARDSSGLTPLYNLVRRSNIKVVQLYLNFKPDLNTFKESGCNLLSSAVSFNKNMDVLQLIIDLGFDIDGRNNESSETPLLTAAFLNQEDNFFDQAEILLKNGARINLHDSQGRTALYHLVYNGNFRIIELFLFYKADVRTIDVYGSNLLFPAASHNKHSKVVQLLVDLGLDVSHTNSCEMTPLHYAANNKNYSESLKILKCLSRKGADFNSVDRSNFTPLAEAMCKYEMGSSSDKDKIKNKFQVFSGTY